jgi:hypothetical protein
MNTSSFQSTCFRFVRVLLVTVTLTLSCPFAANASGPDERLLGTWKSNAELTVASLPGNMPAAQRERFAAMIGSSVTTIDAQTMTTETSVPGGKPALTKKTAYEVTASDKDTVTIVRTDPQVAAQPITFHFENQDRFWISSGSSAQTIKSYFDRAK